MQWSYTYGTYLNERRCTLCVVDVDVAGVAGGVVGSGMDVAGVAVVGLFAILAKNAPKHL